MGGRTGRASAGARRLRRHAGADRASGRHDARGSGCLARRLRPARRQRPAAFRGIRLLGPVAARTFPVSRPAATRLAEETGAAMGVRVKPGGSRPLQPVTNRFFYWLRATALETRRLAFWWLDRMVRTPRPLEEKLTLFWHGHFATGEEKLRDYRKIALQIDTLRRGASGSFADLAGRRVQGSGDAGLSRCRPERQGAPEREFRPRGHGTVHHGRRPLQRGRHPRGGPRLHRLGQ
jgi:hypothetical protein